MLKKNSEATNAFLFKWYKGNKYHVADKAGKFYLCDCCRDSCFEERCGIYPGYRRFRQSPKRNTHYLLRL